MQLKVPKLSKLLWILVLCGSIWGLGYYVSENYIKLNIDPEILVKAEYINSRTVPFPAITICPPNAVSIEFINITKFFNDLKKGQFPDVAERIIMTAASHVCYHHINLLRSFKTAVYNDENIVQIFNKVSPQLDEVFKSCNLGSAIECSKIFIKSSTFLGNCFTFNMQGYHSIFNANISANFDGYKRRNITKSWNPKADVEYHNDEINVMETPAWTISKGYATDDDWVQPLRAGGMQYLTVSTKVNKKEFSNFCKNNYRSYRVIIHLPNEVPTFSNVYSSFNIGLIKYMRIHASISKIDDNLRKFSPEQRKCYYEDERQLKYFKSYTKFNCEHECMANFTYKSCGCISFSMPRMEGTKVCKLEDNSCYSNIYYKWAKSYYLDHENVANFPDFPCNCWPTCTKLTYSIVNEFHMSPDKKSNNYTESGIKIEFGSSQILEKTNYVTYNIENFVSDIGGLAGLFLGFSLLSLYELLLNGFAIIRNFIKNRTCLKGDVHQQNQPKTWGNRSNKRIRRRSKKNKVSPEIFIVDVVLGEEVGVEK